MLSNTKEKKDDDGDTIYLDSSNSTTSKTIQGELQLGFIFYINFVEIEI